MGIGEVMETLYEAHPKAGAGRKGFLGVSIHPAKSVGILWERIVGLIGDTDQRETNTTRLTAILNDAALRLLFREYLRETVCEENLSFWLDVEDFKHGFLVIDKSKPDAVRETLAAAYGRSNDFSWLLLFFMVSRR